MPEARSVTLDTSINLVAETMGRRAPKTKPAGWNQRDLEMRRTETLKKVLRLGLLSLIGYELVLRSSIARQFKNLIDVITQQRIALCHSLINCTHGGLNGSEGITQDEAAFRQAWSTAIKVAEWGDRRDLATELEHVEAMLERFSSQARQLQDERGDESLREVVSSARGCREVWSLIAFVNEDSI